MNPDYFYTRLTYYEALDFIIGLERRYRANYVAARSTNALIGGLFAKDYTPPTFSWEEQHDRPVYTKEEIDSIRQLLQDDIQQADQFFNTPQA